MTTEQKSVGEVDGGSRSSDGDGPRPHVHLKTYIAIFAVCLVYVAQNFAIVGAGAQAQIIGGILNSTDTAWTTASLAIFTVVLGPIVSQGADYWGRKWLLIGCSLFGVVGSIIVARATDMNMAIAGFCILGVAFGAQGLVHAVAGEVLPRRWRSWGQAAAMISTALGLALGLIAAGALNRKGDANGFRNFYYITAGLFGLSAILCLVAYRPPPTKQQLEATTFGAKMARLDWIGYALLASSLVLFCISLTWSLNPYPWSDAHVPATFAVSMVLAIALAVYEWRIPDGLFHHGLFQNRMFPICLLCVFCEGIAFFAAITYFAFQVNVLYESDFLIVTLRFAIGFMATIFGSLATGYYCTKTKKVRWATFAAFIIFIAFFVGMAVVTSNDKIGTPTWGLPILMGWGLGMTIVTLVTAAQLCVPHELIATASCLLISFRSLGGTIGIAIYQAVFTSAMSNLGDNIAHAATAAGLPAESVPDFITDLAAQNTTALLTVPGVTPDIIQAGAGALLGTYASGFHNVWVSAVAFVSLAAIVSLFMFDPSKEFNHHIDAPIEKEETLYSH
ncbi:major facilitator superfamily domain-containing protein [Xylariales sp. AK1849]|nr:major facilitator superfamily domain-containing protein [Xylariales sp. AK1849]